MATRENRIWPYISWLAERFREETPAGMAVVVEVEMMDGKTFRPAIAREDPPWVVFEVKPKGRASEVVVVRENDVRRFHLRYEAGAPERGFRLEPPRVR